MICIICGENKTILAKGKCGRCYSREYKQKHPEYKSPFRPHACNTLKKHHEDMKNDPEHLTTAFIQELIGIKCGEET